MDAIGALVFFLDLLFFHKAIKTGKYGYWLAFVLVNAFGLLIILGRK